MQSQNGSILANEVGHLFHHFYVCAWRLLRARLVVHSCSASPSVSRRDALRGLFSNSMRFGKICDDFENNYLQGSRAAQVYKLTFILFSFSFSLFRHYFFKL